MATSSDIAGYTYKADTYCPEHIVGAMTSTEDYEGWELAEGIEMDIEENLDNIAAHFGIDRQDENSFNSDEFPKVIFRDQADGSACGVDGEPLS